MADANVLFSAFLRGGLTRRLWNKLEIQLYAPEYLLDEYAKHSAELRTRTGLSPEESRRLARKLLTRVNFVEYEEFEAYLPAARQLIVDEKDFAYVACALAVGADLWSRDRHFKQPRVKCWSTLELARHFGYLE